VTSGAKCCTHNHITSPRLDAYCRIALTFGSLYKHSELHKDWSVRSETQTRPLQMMCSSTPKRKGDIGRTTNRWKDKFNFRNSKRASNN